LRRREALESNNAAHIQAQDKAEAKGRAMLTGRRVPKSRMHGSPKLARGISAWLHCNRSNLL
jgi:hypothetical protein